MAWTCASAGPLDLTAARAYTFPVSLEPTGRALQRDATDTLDAIDKVAAMLAAVGLVPEHVVDAVPIRRRVLTAERAAAYAVMAGCLPVHFPVVLAAMEAFFERDPNILHEISAATNAPGWLILVNGPLRRRLGLGCTDNLLSSANRANATMVRVAWPRSVTTMEIGDAAVGLLRGRSPMNRACGPVRRRPAHAVAHQRPDGRP